MQPSPLSAAGTCILLLPENHDLLNYLLGDVHMTTPGHSSHNVSLQALVLGIAILRTTTVRGGKSGMYLYHGHDLVGRDPRSALSAP
jgi:hypothetical protein